MKLRPYQQQAFDNVLNDWETEADKVLLVLPTGCGKTIVFAKIAEELVRQGGRVLILAHRGELLEQARDKIMQATGLGCAMEKAEFTAVRSLFSITVGSVQTLMNEKRQLDFKKNYYTHIIVDEAHHAISDSYMRVFNYFEDAKILGVTATPDRGDKRELGNLFEKISFEYSLPQAIRDGFLVKLKALTCPLKIDLTSVSIQNGDYSQSELDCALLPYMQSIAEEIKKHAKDRKIIIFLPLIATSQKMQQILIQNGFTCGEVNGMSKDREEILEDFHNDKYQILCNSMLLTEGYDEPTVDCIICLRPTKIRALYAQMIGRGTRLSNGKEDLLILDFLWQTSNIKLARPASLLTDDEMVEEKLQQEIEKGETILDAELLEDGESEAVKEREEGLASKLEAMRKKKGKLIDPLQYEMSIHDEGLLNYQPTMKNEVKKPTEEQICNLEKKGISSVGIQSYGQAKMLIDKLDKRAEQGASTPKQIRFLERKKFKQVGDWSFEQAKQMVDMIAGNRWITPRHIDAESYKPQEIK